MNYSRRDVSFLLAALMASAGKAQNSSLASATYKYEDLGVRTNGANHSRAFFNGQTHTGVKLELHETELPPGGAPHPPHHHLHEEMILIREGTMEVTISGRKSTLGPGGVAYVASNEEHGWRNIGTTSAQYFVLAVGSDKA